MLDKIQKRMIDAMKLRNKELVSVLRDIKDRLSQFEKENGRLTGNDCVAVLNKMAKARKQSMEMYQKAARKDLVNNEKYELEIIEDYLPKQLDKDEITAIVVGLIKDERCSDMKDMGKVMKAFNNKYSGQDGKLVSGVVKRLLLDMTQ